MTERVKGFFSKRWVKIALIVIAIAIPASAYGGFRGWRYIKTDPNFCVSCHLMKDAFERWEKSAHKDVACQTCHQADIFEEMRFGFVWLIKDPDEVGAHTKLNAQVCRECHIQDEERWTKLKDSPGHGGHFKRLQGECLQCHVTKAVHSFEPDMAQCQRCHTRQMPKGHEITELHCFGCHDFVGRLAGATEATGLISQVAADQKEGRAFHVACRTCHVAQEGDPVPIVVAGYSKHAGKPVFTHKGHEDCVGCHQPHGGKLDDPIGCLECHRSLLEGGRHLADERVSECLACHEPHNKSE